MAYLIAGTLLLAALACAGFSWWGLNTLSGRAAFDEMAGIIPLAAAPLGLLLAMVAIFICWRAARSRRQGR